MTDLQSAKCEALFTAMRAVEDSADGRETVYREAARQIIEDLSIPVMILSAAGVDGMELIQRFMIEDDYGDLDRQGT